MYSYRLGNYNEEFPGITERANVENAEIFFGDETNIQNTCNYMKGYAPKGKTPVVRTESKKFKINMLSAVSKRGKLRFVLYKDNMDSDKLIDFMRKRSVGSKSSSQSKEELEHNVRSHLKSLQLNPSKIAPFLTLITSNMQLD